MAFAALATVRARLGIDRDDHPVNHALTPEGAVTYKVEPYVVPPTSTHWHRTWAAAVGLVHGLGGLDVTALS